MKIPEIVLTLTVLLLQGTAWVAHAAFPEVPEEAKDELGTTKGRQLRTGFVFMEGRYLRPPYTVNRVGNGIFINRVQVQQPVPWSHFLPGGDKDEEGGRGGKTDSTVSGTESAAKPSTFTPAVKRGSKKISDDELDALNDLFDDDGTSVKPVERMEASAISVTAEKGDDFDDLFDLFGDEEKKSDGSQKKNNPAEKQDAEQKVENQKKGDAPKAVTLDDLFDEAEGTPSLKKEEKTSEEEEEDEAKRALRIKREKAALKEKLERIRKRIELGLAHNEIFFFSYNRPLVNGNYGSARTLMEVLPNALRVSNNAYQLKQHLARGGVYFLDSMMIQAIFENKTTYPALLDRLRRIKTDEARKKSLRLQSENFWD